MMRRNNKEKKEKKRKMASSSSSSDIIVKAPSSKLINLIAEANFTIESAKEKILAAYKYAIEIDHFTPQQAHNILRERLFFSKRYIREVLPLEAKESKFANKPKVEEDEAADVPASTMSELEKFRQEKGKQVAATTTTEEEEEEDDLSARIPDDRDLPPPASMQEQAEFHRNHDYHVPDESRNLEYEIKRHQEVIKHLNERIEYLSRKFEAPIAIDFKDMVLPIILVIDPENKTVPRWRPNEEEILRLQQEEHKKLVNGE